MQQSRQEYATERVETPSSPLCHFVSIITKMGNMKRKKQIGLLNLRNWARKKLKRDTTEGGVVTLFRILIPDLHLLHVNLACLQLFYVRLEVKIASF